MRADRGCYTRAMFGPGIAMAAGMAEPPQPDPVLRIIFALMALALVGLGIRMGLRILALFQSPPPVYGMRSSCPRCQQELHLWTGATRCPKCDLRIVVRFEE